MKLSQKLLLTSQLATLVICEYMPSSVYDVSTHSMLNGTSALTYLFAYDPSRPHSSDGPWRGDPSDLPKDYVFRSYDSNYIARVCSPRSWTGEAYAAVNWDFIAGTNMTREEYEEYQFTWEHWYQVARQAHAGSPYPCERMSWILAECGVNSYTNKPQVEGKGTPQEQNACICKSDYFAAAEACFDCTVLHSGNKTLGEQEAEFRSSVSEAVCGAEATVTQSLAEYWKEVYSYDVNTTIVSDGAQNKTDVSLYYTGGVDFVPATIQDPAFTRTVDGKEVVMTPGPLAAKATAAKTEAAVTGGGTTGSAAAAATSAGGAVNVKVPIGAMGGLVGACLML